MVFYRKYRPQKISELDSEQVRTSLTSILTAKEVPHAFLFTGPRGLGKTSSARILAKTLNCQNKKDGQACNICEQCVSITNGANVDVLEIDAASNRGIDEIRDLREKVKLAPATALYKVYIIDEVHMLTTEAFNALLKMLEEPPAHVVFILCTTEVHKVPETIRSRCFSVSFKKATDKELSRSLKRIIAGEGMESQIDDTAILEIAKFSDGSFRDASKYLEVAVLRQGNKKITQEVVLDLLGNNIFSGDFVTALKKKQTKEALVWLQRAVENGLNIKAWIEDLLGGFHNKLLLYYKVEGGPVAKELDGLTEQEVKKLITLFTRAHQEMRTAVIAQLPAEIAIIEYCETREDN